MPEQKEGRRWTIWSVPAGYVGGDGPGASTKAIQVVSLSEAQEQSDRWRRSSQDEAIRAETAESLKREAEARAAAAERERELAEADRDLALHAAEDWKRLGEKGKDELRRERDEERERRIREVNEADGTRVQYAIRAEAAEKALDNATRNYIEVQDAFLAAEKRAEEYERALRQIARLDLRGVTCRKIARRSLSQPQEQEGERDG